MLGVSRPVTPIVNVGNDSSTNGRAVAFVIKGTIVRSEFGMKFGVPLVGDALEITVKTRALSDESVLLAALLTLALGAYIVLLVANSGSPICSNQTHKARALKSNPLPLAPNR